MIGGGAFLITPACYVVYYTLPQATSTTATTTAKTRTNCPEEKKSLTRPLQRQIGTTGPFRGL